MSEKLYICSKCGAECKEEEILEKGILCIYCKHDRGLAIYPGQEQLQPLEATTKGLDIIDVAKPIHCLNNHNCKEL